jgi:hypothetical protein
LGLVHFYGQRGLRRKKEMETVKKTVNVRTTNLDLESHVIDGEICDTKVNIGSHNLLWIAGNEIDDFVKDFRALVEKYAI